jgi:hypothetical protein
MTFDIKVIGHNELIRTERGESIKREWEAYLKTRKDALIEFGGWTGRLSEIRSIREAKTAPSASQRPNQADVEYRQELFRLRRMSPEARAQRLGFFKFIFYGFHRRNPTEKELKMAQDIQEKFFTEHPKRIMCEPTLWRKILGEGSCNDRFLHIVENQMRQDKFAEAHL